MVGVVDGSANPELLAVLAKCRLPPSRRVPLSRIGTVDVEKFGQRLVGDGSILELQFLDQISGGMLPAIGDLPFHLVGQVACPPAKPADRFQRHWMSVVCFYLSKYFPSLLERAHEYMALRPRK